MIHIELKNARMPALGFGTWDLRGAQCTRAVAAALEMGYRHVDTAQMYENETEVGRGLAESGVPRDEIFLTTKIWYDDLRPAQVAACVETSLARLGVDQVDLLLVHWPNGEVPLDETLDAFAAARTAGHTRHIGVSNFTTALLREAVEDHGADLLCNQVEYHPFLSQAPVKAALDSYGMALTAYCPIVRGRVAGSREIVAIAAAHGKTPVQVTLRWLIQQANVAAIPKAADPAHARANIEIFDFALTPDEMAAISALADGSRLVDPAWAPAWDAA